MLCARVVRGAASRAKAVRPAAFIAAMPSLLKGSSMPTSTVPRFICASSCSTGVRTFRTMSAPSASAGLPIVAPAAVYASSVKLAGTPAPACTITVCLPPTSFFTVSGEAATRVSPGRTSAGTPIFMKLSPVVLVLFTRDACAGRRGRQAADRIATLRESAWAS